MKTLQLDTQVRIRVKIEATNKDIVAVNKYLLEHTGSSEYWIKLETSSSQFMTDYLHPSRSSEVLCAINIVTLIGLPE